MKIVKILVIVVVIVIVTIGCTEEKTLGNSITETITNPNSKPAPINMWEVSW